MHFNAYVLKKQVVMLDEWMASGDAWWVYWWWVVTPNEFKWWVAMPNDILGSEWWHIG